MKNLKKYALFFMFAFYSSPGLGLERVDIMGYVGAGSLHSIKYGGQDFNITPVKSIDYGIQGLFGLSANKVIPIIGFGFHEMSAVTSDYRVLPDGSGQFEYKITTSSLTGHAGVKFNALPIRFFLYGNLGYGLSGKTEETDYFINTAGANRVYTYDMTNHIYFGGTGAVTFALGDSFAMGLSGIYNRHKAKIGLGSVKGDFTYDEIAYNLLVDITL
jgi:hypothetical protein